MKFFSLTIVGLMIYCASYSQEQYRLSLSFEQAPLIALVDSVERQTPFRFYFISAWVDTVTITLKSLHAPLSDVLQGALKNTGIEFFIQGNSVILTPGVALTNHVSLAHSPPQTSRYFADDVSSAAGSAGDDIKEIGARGRTYQSNYTVTGYILERSSLTPLPGAVIRTVDSKQAAVSDASGFYSLRLPRGRRTLLAELIGMTTVFQKINLQGEGTLDFKMEESVMLLDEVVVEADRDANITGVQMGASKIDVKSMKNIPKILGENDLLKIATNLPGVKTVGEGASGINVRGGRADQNLITLNDAAIYNTSHFYGFFSVFNPDAISSFNLYKSGLPVQYGGRLSSAFDFLMRDGSDKKFSGQGGVGPVTSHLTFELPLKKDKTSIMAGGRAVYSNWVLRAIPNSVIDKTRASFYDYFARLTHKANEKNLLSLSLYASHDEFNLSSDTLFSYSNRLASFQWRHVFNSKMDAALSVTHSAYDYTMNYFKRPENAFYMGFEIRESNFKWEVNHTVGKHRLLYGIQSRLYQLNPGFLTKGSDSSIVKTKHLDAEKGLESALFISDNFDLTRALSIYYGLRYSLYAALGPRKIYGYDPNQPRSDNTIVDSLRYSNNQVLKTYGGPEYRVSLRYKLTEQAAIKASYNRTRQYIQMLSNTVSISPTDTWRLSDPNIRPQVADQISLGFYRDWKKNMYELSTEVYYKWIDNILDFKTGATLLVNDKIEQQILQGIGKAYGVEVLLKKNTGKVTGWISYAYARTFVRLNGKSPSERVNNGNFFPANYDKPHDVSLISNYKITRRYSFSFNAVYSTGRPMTYPIAAYRFGNSYRIEYSARNAVRMPDYFRMDVGFNIEGNHRIKKLAHGYWNISVYNILGRKNPYSIFFRIEEGNIKAYKLSVFGVPIPTITYNFKF